MKTLFYIAVGIAAVIVVLYIITIIIGWLYCEEGLEGYEDKWSSARAEKIHYILCPIWFVLLIIDVILLIISTI
jgi:hypothetical protein